MKYKYTIQDVKDEIQSENDEALTVDGHDTLS